MPAKSSLTERRNQLPITAPSGRKSNAIPTTITLDPEAKYLLRELATGKSYGAFIAGLIRGEAARKEAREAERQRLKRLLEEEV
jgi:hypothetical protein